MGDNKKWSAADFTAAGWVVLHFYTSVSAFGYGLYQTYTTRFWILLVVWLLGLLALDAWLYAGWRPGLLRFVKWYWAFSSALAAAVILAADLGLIHDLNGFLIFVVLCSFLTPLHQLMAFAWLLFQWLADLPGMVRYSGGSEAALFVCLLHFVYFAWLCRRAKRREAHGPVDPGAGTVE